MKIKELGHVVLYVRDLDASLRFYRDILGLKEHGRGKSGRIAFLTAGAHHHDLALEARGPNAPRPPAGSTGLYHIAFQVGDDLVALEAARRHLETHGLEIFGEAGNSVSVRDPDGHQVELYVDLGAEEAKPR